MIPLEGALLTGLDEFMLRLGHLKVLSVVADEVGGSWARIQREAGNELTRFVDVPKGSLPAVAEYLVKKRLCFVGGAGESSAADLSRFRYPDLRVERASKNAGRETLTLICLDGGVSQVPKVWWQDLCLADQEVVSRVGAVTTSGKSGSKTGLSHIRDWALALDLVTVAGDLAPEGQLLARFQSHKSESEWVRNPYVLSDGERLVLAFLALGPDIDVFSRLCRRLIRFEGPIRKADGGPAFAETIMEIVEEAESARYLSQRQQYETYQHLRDLERSHKRRRSQPLGLGETSTAWHRASSRLETYVDLGLLEKGQGGEHERYEYTYYSADALRRAVRSIEASSSAREWIEQHLVSDLLGVQTDDEPITPERLLGEVGPVLAALNRPTAPLPIDAVALGLAWVRLEMSQPVSLATARAGIENLARKRPEIARLSRGRSGTRAEYVSFDPRGFPK